MRREVSEDLQTSSHAFKNVVWPEMGYAVGGGEIVPVESPDKAADRLDTIAGIDAWIVQQEKHMFGLASRVQSAEHEYKTFTVRMRRPNGIVTEYEKRCEQIATPGSLYPKWTIQAYVDYSTRSFVMGASALTADVISAVTMDIGYERTAYDGVKFWVVPWADLWNAGCNSLSVFANGSLRRREDAA